MRKIIDGVVYDTKTAKKIGEYRSDSDYDLDLLDYRKETLYRTTDGVFFVHAKDGAWRQAFPDRFDISDRDEGDIILLSKREAMEWLKENVDPPS